MWGRNGSAGQPPLQREQVEEGTEKIGAYKRIQEIEEYGRTQEIEEYGGTGEQREQREQRSTGVQGNIYSVV